jgi:anti-anti-sigma factor
MGIWGAEMEKGAGVGGILAAVFRPNPSIGGAGSTDVLHVGLDGSQQMVFNKKHTGTSRDSSRLEDTLKLIKDTGEAGIRNVVLDLSHTRFIGSQSLEFFVAVWRETMNGGGEFAVTGCHANIKGIIELAKLDQVLRIVDSLEEAVELFSSNGRNGST